MTIQNEILRENAVEWLIDSLGTDEPDILLDVLQTFRGDSANIIARMQEAVPENDEDILFRSAHTLKSSSSIIGAERLANVCEELEWSMRHKKPIDVAATVTAITQAFADLDKLLLVEIEKLENQSSL